MRVLFVVLDILKNILIFILYIIAVLIFLLLIVLFVPIRYNISLSYDTKFVLDIHAAWFFKLLRFDYDQGNNGNGAVFKAFGRQLFRKKENSDNKTSDKEKKKDIIYKHNEESPNADEKTVSNKKNAKTLKEDDLARDDENGDETGEDGVIKKISGYVDKINEFLSYPDKDRIVQLTLLLLKRLLKGLKPDVAVVEGEIGFDDPASTGITLGGAAFISACLPKNSRIDIRGNFEKKTLALNTEIRGSLALWPVIWPIIIYILSEPIWSIVKKRVLSKG